MNVFAKFDEIPSMILEVIKETKRYGQTVVRTVGWSDGQRENSIPSRDGVMVMCNGNALQCITIFKVMGSNV